MEPKSTSFAKAILVFFVSLLSFSVGTFVGYRYSDSKHRIAALEHKERGDEEGDEDSKHMSSSDKLHQSNLSDEEIAKMAEEFVTEDRGGSGHSEKVAKGEHGKGTEEAGEKKHKGEGKKSAHGDRHPASISEKDANPLKVKIVAEEADQHKHQQEAVKKISQNNHHNPEKMPEAMEKHLSEIGKFTVQVASYARAPDAEALVESLKSKNVEAYVEAVMVAEKRWHRVYVGHFEDVASAKNKVKELMEHHAVESTPIVQRLAKESSSHKTESSEKPRTSASANNHDPHE